MSTTQNNLITRNVHGTEVPVVGTWAIDDRPGSGAATAGVGRRGYRRVALLRSIWRTHAECDDRHVRLHRDRTLP